MSVPNPQLFVRQINMQGQTVSRPMSFYVGLNKVGRVATVRTILERGGKVSNEPGPEGSHIIPLIDPHSKARHNCRTAYSVHFINACVQQDKILNLDQFRIMPPATNSGPNTPRNRLKNLFGNVPQQPVSNSRPNSTRPNSRTPQQHGNKQQPVTNSPQSKRVPSAPKQPPPQGGTAPQVQPSNPHTPPPSAGPARERAAQVFPPKKSPSNRTFPSRDSASPNAPTHSTPRKLVWSAAEDKAVANLYNDAISLYKRRGQDPSTAQTMKCWIALERTGLCPTGKAAQDCLDRVLELIESRDSRKKRRASAPTASRNVPAFDENESDSEDGVVPAVPKNRPTGPFKGRKQREVRSATTSPAIRPAEGRASKNGRKKTSERTKERIRWIVKGLAIRGMVSERTAFRAFREKGANWRKALRAIRRNAARENKRQ